MFIKKFDSLYIILQLFILVDALAFFILANKYSGGSDDARVLSLFIIIPCIICFFSLSTFVYLIKSNEACFILLKRLVSVAAFVFLCLSLSMPVFFKHSIFTKIGFCLFALYLSLIVYVCSFTVRYFVVNSIACVSFLKSIVFNSKEMNEGEMSSFLPEGFFFYDKIPVVFGIILLASELAGLSTRNIYPSFASVAISVPLFVAASYFIQRYIAGVCFFFMLRKMQNEFNIKVFFVDKKRMMKKK
ncbi:hypothetical protein [Iodobacter fluviatilis]|uniref:Uncharacterized protein n=1 Tax=Iodobacter fluviatilis TaxID=537 RepID=A0A7G3GC47_9NEIS|nr:hypothetical protein [Iodobacter fluviatilis]QBC44592.1 hypothetical protein C1H71_14370 [Iodobacter fluviatilis]